MFLHFAPKIDYMHVLYNYSDYTKHVYVQFEVQT